MDKVPESREAAKGTKFEELYNTPADWPRNVHHLPLDQLDQLGRDPQTNQLYWDGDPLVTEKRFATQERVIGWISVALAAIGVAATCAQAWFAAFPPH